MTFKVIRIVLSVIVAIVMFSKWDFNDAYCNLTGDPKSGDLSLIFFVLGLTAAIYTIYNFICLIAG